MPTRFNNNSETLKKKFSENNSVQTAARNSSSSSESKLTLSGRNKTSQYQNEKKDGRAYSQAQPNTADSSAFERDKIAAQKEAALSDLAARARERNSAADKGFRSSRAERNSLSSSRKLSSANPLTDDEKHGIVSEMEASSSQDELDRKYIEAAKIGSPGLTKDVGRAYTAASSQLTGTKRHPPISARWKGATSGIGTKADEKLYILGLDSAENGRVTLKTDRGVVDADQIDLGNGVNSGKIARAYQYGLIGASVNQLGGSRCIPLIGVTEMAFEKGAADRNAGQAASFVKGSNVLENTVSKEDESDKSDWNEFWGSVGELLKGAKDTVAGLIADIFDAANDTNYGDALDLYSDVMALLEMANLSEETRLNMIIHTRNVMTIGRDNDAEPEAFVGDLFTQGDDYVEYCIDAYEAMYKLAPANADLPDKFYDYDWSDLESEEQAALVGCMRVWNGEAYGKFVLGTGAKAVEIGAGIIY